MSATNSFEVSKDAKRKDLLQKRVLSTIFKDLTSNDEAKQAFASNLMSKDSVVYATLANDQIRIETDRAIQDINRLKCFRLHQNLTDTQFEILKHDFPEFVLSLGEINDAGDHPFFRAQAILAREKLLQFGQFHMEKIPKGKGYTHLIKEVGANLVQVLNSDLDIYPLTPMLSTADLLRHKNSYKILQKEMTSADKHRREKATWLYESRDQFKVKAENDSVRAPYLLWVFSSFDSSAEDLCRQMHAAGAEEGYGVVHCNANILSTIRNGSENGMKWETTRQNFQNSAVETHFFFDRSEQAAYSHDTFKYLDLIHSSVVVLSDLKSKPSYVFQHLETRGTLLFFKIVLVTEDIPAATINRRIPFGSADLTDIEYYDTDPSITGGVDALYPIRIRVPSGLFDATHRFAWSLGEGKFTVQNIINYSLHADNRLIINGHVVYENYKVPVHDTVCMCYCIMLLVYSKRWDYGKAMKKVKDDIDNNREKPSFTNAFFNLFRHTRKVWTGAPSNLDTYMDELKATYEKDTTWWNTYSEDELPRAWYARLYYFATHIKQRPALQYPIKAYVVPSYLSHTVSHFELAKSEAIAIREYFTPDEILAPLAKTDYHHSYKRFISLDKVTTVEPIEVTPSGPDNCVLDSLSYHLKLSVSNIKDKIATSSVHSLVPKTFSSHILDVLKNGPYDIEFLEFALNVFDISAIVSLVGDTLSFGKSKENLKYFRIDGNVALHCQPARLCVKHLLPFPIDTLADHFADLPPTSIQEDTATYNTIQGLIDDYVKLHSRTEFKKRCVEYTPLYFDETHLTLTSSLKLHELFIRYGITPGKNILDTNCFSGVYGELLSYTNPILLCGIYNCKTNPKATNNDYYSHINYNTNGDLTDPKTLIKIKHQMYRLNQRFDLIIHDSKFKDISTTQSLITSHLDLAMHFLRNGGNLILSCNTSMYNNGEILSGIITLFEEVILAKPTSTSVLTGDFFILGLRRRAELNFPNTCSPEILFTSPTPGRKLMKKFVTYAFDDQLSNLECLTSGAYFTPCKHSKTITEVFIQSYLPTQQFVEYEETSDYASVSPDSVSCESFETTVPTAEEPDNAELDIIGEITQYISERQIEPVASFGLNYSTTINNLNAHFTIIINDFTHHSQFGPSGNNHLKLCSVAHIIYINTRSEYKSLLHSILSITTNYFGYHIAIQIEANEVIHDVITICSEPHFLSCIKITLINTSDDFVKNHINDSDPKRNLRMQTVTEYTSYLAQVITTDTIEHNKVFNSYISTRLFQRNPILFGALAKSSYKFGIIRRVATDDIYQQLSCGYQCQTPEKLCFYNGDFRNIASIPHGEYALTSEKTRMHYDDITYNCFIQYHNDIVSLSSVDITLEQGVGGNGKTHEIVHNYLKDTPAKEVLVLAPTREAVATLINRARSVVPASQFIQENFMTVNAYITGKHKNLLFKRVFVDEALMLHPAMILLIAARSKATAVHCYGDMVQANFHPMITFDIMYGKFDIYRLSEPRFISHRCPADALYAVQPHYDFLYQKYGLSLVINRSDTKVLRSMTTQDVSHCTEVPVQQDTIYLGFSNTDVEELRKRLPHNLHNNIYTVRKFQGRDAPRVILYRDTPSPFSEIHASINLTVSALTRHKLSFAYYTRCHDEKDLIRTAITKTINAPDSAIIKHSITRIPIGTYRLAYENPVSSRFTPPRITYVTTRSNNHIPNMDKLHPRAIANYVKTNPGASIHHKTLAAHNISVINLNRTLEKFAPGCGNINVIVSNVESKTSAEIIDHATDALISQNIISTCDVVFVKDEIETIPEYYPRVSTTSQPVAFYQDYVNKQFPGVQMIDTSYDSYHSQMGVSFHLPQAKISTLQTLCVDPETPSLAPHLLTPCPRLRPNNFFEVTNTLCKRNLNPPELLAFNNNHLTAMQLLQCFTSTYLKTNYRSLLMKLSSIGPTLPSVVNWLHKQPTHVPEQIVADVPLRYDTFNTYSVIIKRAPKIRLDFDCFDQFPALQSIIYCEKRVNAIFCPIIDKMKNRTKALLDPRYMLFCDVSPEEFAQKLQKVCPAQRVNYGDEILELDASQYDQSQGIWVLEFECLLMRFFGVREPFITLWYASHYYKIVRDRKHHNSFILPQQRTSGDGGTWYFNTMYLMALLAHQFDLSDVRFALFSGDDSLILSRKILRHSMDRLPRKFNLQIKMFDYKSSFYFCSKFLLKTTYGWCLLPDPLKILVKLGSHNIKHFDHLEMIRISLVDLTSQYNRADVINAIDKAMQDRYPRNSNYAALIMALHGLANNKADFTNMFYVPHGVILDNDPSVPNLDY